MKVVKQGQPAHNPVYIGRGSVYGNPYRMQDYRQDRGLVVALYARYFIAMLLTSKAFRDEVNKLDLDNDLVCHCAPEACHGDVIHEFVVLKSNVGYEQTLSELIKKHRYLHLPLRDGVTHVNMYSKSRTTLGKMLSNFTASRFEHPVFGRFESMEGFWYFLKTGCKHEVLRSLVEYDAKKQGRVFESVHNPHFDQFIEEGLECKIRQNPELMAMFQANTLPYMHYYVYGDPHNAKVVHCDPEGKLVKMLNRIAGRLREDYVTIIAGSRNFHDLGYFEEEMSKVPWRIKEVIEGGAKGADLMGNLWAKKYHIPFRTFAANWDEFGKGAGAIRNREMEKIAQRGVIFIKDQSRGSTDMANLLQQHNKQTYIARP